MLRMDAGALIAIEVRTRLADTAKSTGQFDLRPDHRSDSQATAPTAGPSGSTTRSGCSTTGREAISSHRSRAVEALLVSRHRTQALPLGLERKRTGIKERVEGPNAGRSDTCAARDKRWMKHLRMPASIPQPRIRLDFEACTFWDADVPKAGSSGASSRAPETSCRQWQGKGSARLRWCFFRFVPLSRRCLKHETCGALVTWQMTCGQIAGHGSSLLTLASTCLALSSGEGGSSVPTFSAHLRPHRSDSSAPTFSDSSAPTDSFANT